MAATIAGIAAWISRASFDVAGTSQTPVRVAMLPSVAELIGLVVLALLTAAGFAWALRLRQAPGSPFWNAAEMRCCRSSPSRCSSFPIFRG